MVINTLATRVQQLGRQKQAVAGLFIAMLAGSAVTVFVRLSQAPNMTKVFYRLLLAVLLLAPWTYSRYREELMTLSTRNIAAVSLAGVMLGAQLTLFFQSLEWTSIAASTALTQLQVVFVAVGAYFIPSESLDRRLFIAIGLALVGVGITFAGAFGSGSALAGRRPLAGNALALLSGLSFAIYLLLGRELRQRVTLFPYIIVVYTAASIAVFAYTVFSGISLSPALYTPEEWFFFLGMAVTSGVVAQVMINFAIKYLSSGSVSLFVLGFPVVSAIYGIAAFGEIPSLATVVGGVFILLSIYFTTATQDG